MFIAITVLVLIASLWAVWFLWTDDGAPALGALVLGSLVGFVLYSALVALPATMVRILYTEDVEVTIPIYEMGDSLGVKGRMFLGSGSIESDPAFMYYAKDTEGFLRLRHIRAARVQIVETDNERPHYVKICKDRTDTPGWLRAPWLVSYSEEQCPADGTDTRTFYVPRGSVAGNFELDAS